MFSQQRQNSVTSAMGADVIYIYIRCASYHDLNIILNIPFSLHSWSALSQSGMVSRLQVPVDDVQMSFECICRKLRLVNRPVYQCMCLSLHQLQLLGWLIHTGTHYLSTHLYSVHKWGNYYYYYYYYYSWWKNYTIIIRTPTERVQALYSGGVTCESGGLCSIPSTFISWIILQRLILSRPIPLARTILILRVLCIKYS